MIYTINSPLIPLFFKQGIIDDNRNKIGYITATNIGRQLVGEMSYKAKIYDTEVSIIEQKKKNNQRNWKLYILLRNSQQEIGRLVLKSSSSQTLKNAKTNYSFVYKRTNYQIMKPYMQSTKPFNMIDDSDNEVAKHEKMNYLDRNRCISIFNSNDNVFDVSVVLAMSVVKYIS